MQVQLLLACGCCEHSAREHCKPFRLQLPVRTGGDVDGFASGDGADDQGVADRGVLLDHAEHDGAVGHEGDLRACAVRYGSGVRQRRLMLARRLLSPSFPGACKTGTTCRHCAWEKLAIRGSEP